jgi:hypothetical protein
MKTFRYDDYGNQLREHRYAKSAGGGLSHTAAGGLTGPFETLAEAVRNGDFGWNGLLISWVISGGERMLFPMARGEVANPRKLIATLLDYGLPCRPGRGSSLIATYFATVSAERKLVPPVPPSAPKRLEDFDPAFIAQLGVER